MYCTETWYHGMYSRLIPYPFFLISYVFLNPRQFRIIINSCPSFWSFEALYVLMSSLRLPKSKAVQNNHIIKFLSFILIPWSSLCSDVLLCRTSWQQRTVCATAWMALRFTLASRRWSGCLTPTDLAESVRADLLLVCNWCVHCAHNYLPLHSPQRKNEKN